MSEPVMKKSQMKLWFLIPLLVFIGLMVMLFFRLGKPTEIIPTTALNRPVPAFELPLLTDTSVMVNNSQLPTSPYLLNVWGSWCPTCIVEHPFLLQMHEQGIPIVGVNYKDEYADAMNYLNERGNPFVMSVQDMSGGFALDLGLTGAPETFVVDAQGNIRQHIVGEINSDNWQTRIEPCLSLLNRIANTADNPANQKDVAEVCQ